VRFSSFEVRRNLLSIEEKGGHPSCTHRSRAALGSGPRGIALRGRAACAKYVAGCDSADYASNAQKAEQDKAFKKNKGRWTLKQS